MALLQALRQAAGLQTARHGGSALREALLPAIVLTQQLRGYAAPSNQLQLIKELRERTGAPMTDVKTALQAANWDLGTQNVAMRESATRQNRLPTSCHCRRQLLPAALDSETLRILAPNPCLLTVRATLIVLQHHADAAVAELRKKGLAAANKKASRHAAEGLVGLAKGDGVAAVVEVRMQACGAPSGGHLGPGSCCQSAVRLGGRRLLMRHASGHWHCHAIEDRRLPQAATPINSTPRHFRNEAEPASLGHPSRRHDSYLFSIIHV